MVQSSCQSNSSYCLSLSQQILSCSRCSLRQGCGSPVPGRGPQGARLFIVGDHPGKDEDLEVEPFVGRYRDLLNNLLTHAEIDPSTVYTTYAVKCMGEPKARHVEACEGWLKQELDLHNPKVVVTLGKRPTALLLGQPSVKLHNAIGKFLYHCPNWWIGDVIVAPWFDLKRMLTGGRWMQSQTISFLKQVKERCR